MRSESLAGQVLQVPRRSEVMLTRHFFSHVILRASNDMGRPSLAHRASLDSLVICRGEFAKSASTAYINVLLMHVSFSYTVQRQGSAIPPEQFSALQMQQQLP